MKQYHIISRIAIYLLAIILIVYGVLHFYVTPNTLVIYIPISVPKDLMWWKYPEGIAFIFVGLSFILNKWVKVTGYLLAVLLILFIIPIDVNNAIYGTKEVQIPALINFLKDAAIACFALHIAAGAYHQHLHLEESD